MNENNPTYETPASLEIARGSIILRSIVKIDTLIG
jgi:hypothetical protein